jgi:hypothetical protein
MDSYDQIEQLDPVADGTSIFYTGPETARHPALIRFHKKLMDRYPYRKTETLVMIPSRGSRPFSDTDPTIIDEARKRRPEYPLGTRACSSSPAMPLSRQNR